MGIERGLTPRACMRSTGPPFFIGKEYTYSRIERYECCERRCECCADGNRIDFLSFVVYNASKMKYKELEFCE